jgi:ribose transport system permease protein
MSNEKKEPRTTMYGEKRVSPLKRFFLQPYSSAVVAIVLLFLIFSVSTDSFLSQYNMFNLSRTAAIYGFIAAAQLMVVVIGGMNLSVGAVGSLCTVLMGELMQNVHMATFPTVILTILVGAACGFLNGFLINKLKLQPFVITLAMSFVFNGLSVGISHGMPYNINKGFSNLGRGQIGPTSTLFLLMVLMVLVLMVFFRYMRIGRDVLAVGGNETAAALSGIKVDQVNILCSTTSCMFSAVAALLWASRSGSATATTGSDWMLYSFAICAIGGIRLNGGNFTAIGFFCGAWILTMIRNGLTMMKVDIYYEQAFLGLIILLAVSLESLRVKMAQQLS